MDDMKSKFLIPLLIFAASFAFSCKSDSDDPTPGETPNFVYQGKDYLARTTGIADYGNQTDSVHSYRRVDFYLSNAVWNEGNGTFSGATWYLYVRANLSTDAEIQSQRITYTKEKNVYDELINKAGNTTHVLFIKKAAFDNEGDLDLSNSDYVEIEDTDNFIFDITKNTSDYTIKVGGTVGKQFVDGTYTGVFNPY